VRNPKQAIAIGLSKARRAGVLPPPAPGGAKEQTRKSDPQVRRARSRRMPKARLPAAGHAAVGPIDPDPLIACFTRAVTALFTARSGPLALPGPPGPARGLRHLVRSPRGGPAP